MWVQCRRGATDGYGHGVNREPRGGYLDRDREVSEQDRWQDHDNNNNGDGDSDYRRRRTGGDDGRRRRRDDYDDGRHRRDNGRDGRRTDDDDRPRCEDYQDRARDRVDRPLRDVRDGERGGTAQRSASPRRSRPRSPSHSRSVSASAPPPEDKAKPDFAPSGLLAVATNMVKNADGTSTLLKYNEPPEARKPLVGWQLYVFKGDEQLGALHLIYFAAHTS